VAFKFLFKLYDEARSRSGVMFPRPLMAMAVIRNSLGDPAYRLRWLGLAVLTIVLLTGSAISLLVLGA